jgi:hypothetical protein
MHIQEATLRTLAAAGSVRELAAQRVRSGDGWVWTLLVRTSINEAPLERQRGGTREFKTLDALAALVDSLGMPVLIVNLNAG